MAIRTDAASVQAILLNQYDIKKAPDLTAFMRTASNLVTRVQACATAKGTPLTSDELIDLETWLAAHFYGVADQMYQAKNTEKAGATYQGKTDMGLKSTIYGQQALAMDTSGCLNGIAVAARASGFWLGTKDPSDGSVVNINDGSSGY